MGKHDMAGPINETLEQHYQSEIKRLNTKIAENKETIDEQAAEIERLKLALKMKRNQIEVLLEKLVER